MKSDRTRSQERILQLLQQFGQEMSAQDIYVELRSRNQTVGLATVYRSLDGLKLQGAIQVRILPTGESLYGCLLEDRHHLTCLRCGQSLPIDECPVEQLERQLQATHKFQVYYHTLEFFGMCARCVAAGEVPVRVDRSSHHH